MNIQTSTNVTLTFALDEPEARAILVDPSAFQAQLRDALAQAHRNGHRNDPIFGGGTDGRAKRGKAPHRKASARSSRNPFAHIKPCPECGLKYHRQTSQCTLNPHRQRVPPATDASAA